MCHAVVGMSDILSPFLVVFPDNDALAFMSFSALMSQIRQNFLEGQPGVHASIQHIGSLLQHADQKLWRQVGQHPPSTYYNYALLAVPIQHCTTSCGKLSFG